MKKQVVLGFLLVLAITFTAGWALGETLPLGPERFTKKFAGQEISVLMVQHTTSEVLQEMIPEFEKMTGIKVKSEITSHEGIHQKSVLDLSGGTASYDIMHVDQPWKYEYLATGNVLRVDDYIAKEDPFFIKDFVETVHVQQNVDEKGHSYGVDSFQGIEILNYRKDLFEQEAANYKNKTGKELVPPTTWREYADVAKYFTKKHNPDSPTDYGVPLTGVRGSPAFWQIQPLLWGVGGREFDKDYKVTINQGKSMEAWEILKELVDYAQPSASGDYWDEMTKVFRLGKAALMQQWDSLSTPNELPGSPVKGKVGYALMPGKASAIGGFAFYINKNSKRKDAAWEFVRWAAGPEIAKTLAKRGGVPGRTSVMTDPELLKDHPYFPAQLENLKIAQARGSACPTCPMIVPTNEYEIIVGTEASYLIAGEKTPQEAADSAAKGLAKLLKDFGYTK